MPLNANEEALLGKPTAEDLEYEHQRLEYSPQERNKIGKWTIVALIINRTIGSGIFLTPHHVLEGAGCVGGAMFLWVAGALISVCGLYVWLECGLSMPQRRVRGEAEPRGVPRSGGEKNFLEFMFPDSNLRIPHIRTTCCFAMIFILMYNLSANAIAFGIQVLKASGRDEQTRGPVLGIAVGVLSVIVMLHTLSRRGGILVNNAFAILKVGVLLVIICLGIAYAAGSFGGSGSVASKNFTQDVWKTQRSDVASWSRSLTLCMYSFWGFEQPFYVLAEVKSPRRYFPRYTVFALLSVIVLYVLVVISYLLVVDKTKMVTGSPEVLLNDVKDLASQFFDKLFGGGDERGAQTMSAIIAVSIFGNLWVMTFTAARVKQEIAKEGILPLSLYIATSYKTPFGLWKQWRSNVSDEDVEKAPTAAFGLHWFTSVLLVVLVAPIVDPSKAYTALVQLYSYTIISFLGCWVSIGLIRIKLRKTRWHWQDRRRYRPWLSPIHAIVFGLATAYMLVSAFVPPAYGSPFDQSVTGMAWYIVPVVGITAPLWGILWYFGLLAYEWQIGRHLVVSREAYWTPDPDCPGEYLQQAEIVDHRYAITPRSGMTEDFEEPYAAAEELKRPYVRESGFDSSEPRLEIQAGAHGAVTGVRRVPIMSERRLSDSFD